MMLWRLRTRTDQRRRDEGDASIPEYARCKSGDISLKNSRHLLLPQRWIGDAVCAGRVKTLAMAIGIGICGYVGSFQATKAYLNSLSDGVYDGKSFRLEKDHILGLDGTRDSGSSFVCECNDSFSRDDEVKALEIVDKTLPTQEQLDKWSTDTGVKIVLEPQNSYLDYAYPGKLERHPEEDLPYEVKDGFDPVCSAVGKISSKNSWFRDNFVSEKCGTPPPERALAFALANILPGWSEANKVHESSPSPQGLSMEIRQLMGALRYVGSQYDPTKQCGEVVTSTLTTSSKCVSVDLEDQDCFEDESFDIVITQDVLDHIYDYKRTFEEIERTLRPGGFHIFSVPTVNKHLPTIPLVTRRVEDGSVILHSPPDTRRNPMGTGNSLITYRWGYDIIDLIKEAAPSMDSAIVFVDGKSLGIQDTEYREVFVSQKRPPLIASDGTTNPHFAQLSENLKAMSQCPRAMVTCKVL